MRNKLLIVLSLAIGMLFVVNPTYAHVVVKPGAIGVGERANFTVSVPTEEEVPTIQLRLVIPDGVQSVRPNVKPGWTVKLVKSGEGEDAKITEIIWSGGSIPAEQRDEFVFSAQAPAEETSLNWKAYQTYGDGDIVAWENSPEVIKEYTKNNPPKEGMDDHNAPMPYSVTEVKNDLASDATQTVHDNSSVKSTSSNSFYNALTIAALAISVVALGGTLLHKKEKHGK